MITNTLVLGTTEIQNKTFQIGIVNFRRTGAKFAQTADCVSNIRVTGDIAVHQFTIELVIVEAHFRF